MVIDPNFKSLHPQNAHRKSRWDSSASTTTFRNQDKPSGHQKPFKASNSSIPPTLIARPSPKPTATTSNYAMSHSAPSGQGQFLFPELGPAPQPTYGFHMLDRRTIVLVDGSVRSYFALPPDYHDPPPRFLLPPLVGPEGSSNGSRFPPMSPEGLGKWRASLKRKFDHASGGAHRASSPYGRMGTRDEMVRSGKFMRTDGVARKQLKLDPVKLRKALLRFVKLINENEGEKKRYLEDGKRLRCLACGRSSEEFADMHALIMHAYNSDNTDLLADHLGLHKALCFLMGWNHTKPPDNTKSYQFLPADEAQANQDDLILWPPIVIIHNTATGRNNEGRVEGLGSKAVDAKIKEMGFSGGKAKSLYGREGHLGVTLVKYGGDASSFKEAVALAEHLERENHGRRAWIRLQHTSSEKDDERNPNLVKPDCCGEKRRILYGYLATASDLSTIDVDSRKKVTVESRKERETNI